MVAPQGGPDPGFTQRATIDLDVGEVYVLSGLVRERCVDRPDHKVEETVKNTLWVYRVAANSWSACSLRSCLTMTEDTAWYGVVITHTPSFTVIHQNDAKVILLSHPLGAVSRVGWNAY